MKAYKKEIFFFSFVFSLFASMVYGNIAYQNSPYGIASEYARTHEIASWNGENNDKFMNNFPKAPTPLERLQGDLEKEFSKEIKKCGKYAC